MINDYVRKVHSAMQTREEDTIVIYKNRLSEEDISLIEELADIYDKKIILSTLQEILDNKEENVYIVE